MVDGWVRATASNPNNSGFFGSVPLISVGVDQTVLRAWWNVGLYYLSSDENVYPPGNSILRTGVVYDVADLEPLETPTPISNADADWLAITTMNPHVVQLSRATNVAWYISWGFPVDMSIKSQRRNDTEAARTLYLAYEFGLSGEIMGYTLTGWWCSIDALLRTP